MALGVVFVANSADGLKRLSSPPAAAAAGVTTR